MTAATEALTDDGRVAVERIARAHDVGPDAVVNLLHALERGGGRQAQFSHPDLGGMGQWSRHGMIMVGDMFNDGLKARVGALCGELSALLDHGSPFRPEARRSAPGGGAWWPADCGTPHSSGSQNDMRYACFPDTRRLAIEQAGTLRVYDTGDHRISGVSQQQGGGQDLAFTSQHGTVRLHELQSIGEAVPKATPPTPDLAPDDRRAPAPKASDDVFATLERLHELHRKGILSESEFADKKKELLARL